MSFQTVAGVLCAVGMFLFGVDIIGDGLSNVCAQKMKSVLRACTKNRFTGVLTGFAVTAAIQSSCATTVMAVSFIDCGAMTLSQSVGVIMGANIGTTMTSVLLAVNFSAAAPLAVFCGTAMKMFSKNEKIKNIGLVICGFGLLFTAMSSMSEYLAFFGNSEKARQLLSNSLGPLQSLCAGFVITAIMQSSSATVGVLQSAAAGGLIGMKNCVYMLFGQNIGAVLPTLLSCVRANSQAKKAAVVHLLFNLFGTGIFIAISVLTPYISLIDSIENKKFAVSMAHVIFNVFSVIILFPFGEKIANLADRIVSFFEKGRVEVIEKEAFTAKKYRQMDK